MGTVRGALPNSKGLHIYSVFLVLALSFTFSLTHFQTTGEAFFLKSFLLDTEKAFRSEQKGFSSARPSFPLIHFYRVPLCTAIICMVETVCHNGIFSHLSVPQLFLIVLKRGTLCFFPPCVRECVQ